MYVPTAATAVLVLTYEEHVLCSLPFSAFLFVNIYAVKLVQSISEKKTTTFAFSINWLSMDGLVNIAFIEKEHNEALPTTE